MARIALGLHGEQSVKVRQFTEWVTQGISPKDYLSEILAVRNVLVQPSPFRPGVPLFRYVNDPLHVEWIKTPERLIKEIEKSGTTALDCDESACLCSTMFLQLGREAEYVGLGFGGTQLTHVGVRVREPKSNQWIWIDTVAGPREREAAARAKQKVFWSLD